MAKKPPKLTVLTTPNATADLAQIWSWNASYYDPDHADAYIDFLKNETDKLETDYAVGPAVPGFPNYQYIVIRKGEDTATSRFTGSKSPLSKFSTIFTQPRTGKDCCNSDLSPYSNNPVPK